MIAGTVNPPPPRSLPPLRKLSNRGRGERLGIFGTVLAILGFCTAGLQLARFLRGNFQRYRSAAFRLQKRGIQDRIGLGPAPHSFRAFLQPKGRSPMLSLVVYSSVAALPLCVPCVVAQPSMVTILTNGPVSNRLNVVVLSEAYTTNVLGQFLVDATNAVNALLNYQPYTEYRSYFNAFAIKVASNQTNSDHPAYGIYHNTYFNSSYDSASDYLITIPPNQFDTNYAHGQGKIDSLLQTFMPRCHLPVLLVYDRAAGGSDGFDKTAVTATGVSIYDLLGVLPHESGHVLANLGDEYTNAYPGFPDTEEPNTTRQTDPALVKWKAWIPTNTPIPTPSISTYLDTVGLFQGAHYHPTNWYRPQIDCAMHSFSAPFCAVCSEALVLSIYQKVRPIDAFAPASTNLSLTSTQSQSFTLSLLQPATHNLTIQWLTNGVPVPGATNPVLTLLPQSLGNGSNSVSAIVKDPTSLVRNDPTNLLSQTVTWSVNVSLPFLRLDSQRWLNGGKFSFRVSGNAPAGFVIQSSTNLLNWTPLATNSLTAGQFWFTNTSTPASPLKFFRAVTPQ